MVRLWVSMVVMLLLGGVAHAAADRPAVLIFGDSLSAGYGIKVDESWPSLLQQRLRQQGYKHSVINASVSGETTAGGARRLPALLAAHAPQVVVLALGSNDGLRGINVTETRKNLATMLTASKTHDSVVVMLKVRIPPNYGRRYASTFEAVFDELGADPGVVYAPFMLESFAQDLKAFQADGLHPTAAAQMQILDTLWPSLVSAIDARTTVSR